MSHDEYGELLYHNPRGISCAKCHGDLGEGMTIVNYKEGNRTLSLVGPDIRQKSFSTMVESLKKYHKVMPRYYLTKKEVKAIYDYIEKRKGKN
jgi:mono/diheme cytochrome c family protein